MKKPRWLGVVLGLALAPAALVKAQDPAEKLANEILAKLTLQEKVSLCHGNSTFYVNAIPRVGLKEELSFSDGPHNVRPEIARDSWNLVGGDKDFSTSLPPLTALAATWDPTAATRFGNVIGAEARSRGKDVMLGPGVNIMRTPLGGRNFEYLGEDPALAAALVAPLIRAVQSHDVASCVKHFALNNQELNRMGVNVQVDERTLREIYLPAFHAAVVDGGALVVMNAYNRFRGDFCSHNAHLDREILKGEWGFKGFVVTDWGSLHDTIQGALAGTDVEMNGGRDIKYFKQPLVDAVKQGKVPESVVDDKARRVLYVMARIHKIGGAPRQPGARNTPQHQATAREIAQEAIVLLKNDGGVLPLDQAALKTLLVVGDNATRKHCTEGGSAMGKPPYEVTPLEGLRRLVGDQVEIEYVKSDHAPLEPLVQKARAADAVLLFVGTNHDMEQEGGDRKDLRLPAGQDQLVKALLPANPRTVIVNLSGAPVQMPWVHEAKAIVQYWFCGMEGGTALAKVLFGVVNPSGKLPFTFPARLADSPAHALGNYHPDQVTYAEGVLVGYRWFDAKNITPLFPFGHGLSYTTFKIGAPQLSTPEIRRGGNVTVKVQVTNTGTRAGAEVVQLYVAEQKPSVPRPPKELKAFRKIFLEAGQSKTIAWTLTTHDLAFWDVDAHGWKTNAGTFDLLVGNSSRNITGRVSVTVP